MSTSPRPKTPQTISVFKLGGVDSPQVRGNPYSLETSDSALGIKRHEELDAEWLRAVELDNT